jgi:hypothetical protein
MDAFAIRKNETLKQLIADKSSASRKDLNEYLTTIIKRYKDSPTMPCGRLLMREIYMPI